MHSHLVKFVVCSDVYPAYITYPINALHDNLPLPAVCTSIQTDKHNLQACKKKRNKDKKKKKTLPSSAYLTPQGFQMLKKGKPLREMLLGCSGWPMFMP